MTRTRDPHVRVLQVDGQERDHHALHEQRAGEPRDEDHPQREDGQLPMRTPSIDVRRQSIDINRSDKEVDRSRRFPTSSSGRLVPWDGSVASSRPPWMPSGGRLARPVRRRGGARPRPSRRPGRPGPRPAQPSRHGLVRRPRGRCPGSPPRRPRRPDGRVRDLALPPRLIAASERGSSGPPAKVKAGGSPDASVRRDVGSDRRPVVPHGHGAAPFQLSRPPARKSVAADPRCCDPRVVPDEPDDAAAHALRPIDIRDGVVTRPAGAWTPTVHAFLRRLRAQGLESVPEPLGTAAAPRPSATSPGRAAVTGGTTSTRRSACAPRRRSCVAPRRLGRLAAACGCRVGRAGRARTGPGPLPR